MTLLPLLVAGAAGLGDNIYQRPFVRELAREWGVYLETPWPQLYSDLDIRVVPHGEDLRTQQKNMARMRAWSRPPKPPYYRLQLGYGATLPGRSIVGQMGLQVPVPAARFVFDLPKGQWPRSLFRAEYDSSRPLAVIRPVTVRREWMHPARAPKPEYVGRAARILRKRGYQIVSVADVHPPDEVFLGRPPVADTQFHRGELKVEQLIGVMRRADVVVGGVGFILPMAIATKTPLIMIAGGCGRCEHPDRLTDPRLDLAAVRWLLPDPYCLCGRKDHDCPKTIPDFAARFRTALDEVIT